MKIAPSTEKANKDGSTKCPITPASQLLKPGKRRVVGATKFGQDGCGY